MPAPGRTTPEKASPTQELEVEISGNLDAETTGLATVSTRVSRNDSDSDSEDARLKRTNSCASIATVNSLDENGFSKLHNAVKQRKRSSRLKETQTIEEHETPEHHSPTTKTSSFPCCGTKHSDSGHGKGHDAHGHHLKEHSFVNAVLSGFINYLLMFGLCCAYGMIMFSDDFHSQHRALGVKLNLSTAFMLGLLCSWKSKVAVAIGGPDLNPVIFLGTFVEVISKSIAKHNGLEEDYPSADGRRLTEDSSFSFLRRLGGGGGGGGVDFCIPGGYHESKHMAACHDYHEQLRATIIFATAVSSGILGLIYFAIGWRHITRFVSYVPASVQEAFLSCIGYKVFKYALGFCNYAPLQFTPAACIGVILYFLKANHIGNPAVVIPVMILLPLAFFHMVVFLADLDIEGMRAPGTTHNWMFPKLTHVNFWELWTDSYGKYYQIDFMAWVETLPDLAIMVIVCVIDCLLQLSSTETKLPVTVDKDYESRLLGMGNVLTTLTGSSVGYIALKFNIVNFGVLGNVTDRRGGIVYAVLCGGCFFGTVDYFNFLPRFFLGSMLFFAGAGFVAEHLWGSRKFLVWAEWCEILLILAVFIFSGSLVAAVIVGILVTWVTLTWKYTKISCIAGTPVQGGQLSSCERVNPTMLGQKSHIADSWFVVIRLKGFIFYASAQAMAEKAIDLINSRKGLPAYRHLRYVVFDCELLDGIDASAGKPIRKLVIDAKKANVKLLWSHASEEFADGLLLKGMIGAKEYAFHNLDVALLHIEHVIMEYQKAIQSKWLQVDHMFYLQHKLARFEYDQDPWGDVLLKFTARQGCPWNYCDQICLQKCSTILWTPGQMDCGLFLIHSGRVALFAHIPTNHSQDDDWPDPVAVYGHGAFLNQEFIFGRPTRYYAVAIDAGEAIAWSREQWWRMCAERPAMAAEISQQALDADRSHYEDHMAPTAKEETERELQQDASNDINQMDTGFERQISCEWALPYDDIHRAALPAPLRTLINSLEIAEVFGLFGTYERGAKVSQALTEQKYWLHPEAVEEVGTTRPREGDTRVSQGATWPDLPDAIGEDLAVAFNTYAVYDKGAMVLPFEQVHTALAYAGISRVLVAPSNQTSFSRAEFTHLGHLASMASLPAALVAHLKDLLLDFKQRRGWKPGLQADQISTVLSRSFHRSLTPDLIQGLMDEMGKKHTSKSDEEVFLSICSRLIRRHEQHWNLLCAIRQAASPDEPCTEVTISNSTFSRLSLMNLLQIDKETASELLWACDWPRRHATGVQWGKGLHVYDVALCVLTQVSPPSGNLHPPPVTGKGVVPDQNGGSVVDVDTVAQMSKLIVDLSNSSSIREEFIEEQLSGPSAAIEATASQDTQEWSFEAPSPKSDEEVEMFKAERNLTLRQKIHIMLEDPGSSTLANWVSVTMGVMILISILTMVIRPSVEHGRESEVTDVEAKVWYVFEFVLTVIFTLDYLVRISVANAMGTQTTLQFAFTPANICDFTAIIPFYIEVCLGENAEEFRLLRVVRLLRLTRIARIGRLARRSELFAPIGTVLLVIWGIYMKTGL